MLHEPARTRYDLDFTLMGIPVRVNPFFWLMAAFLGWDDSPGDSGQQSIKIGILLIWMGCVFVSVLVHEMGHALAARHYGLSNVRIVLHGMGGVAISDSGLGSRQRIIQLILGPGAGFILFGIIFIISRLTFDALRDYIFYGYAVYYLLWINLVWGVLNLLPIYPLDGGQILGELIKIKRPWLGLGLTFKISMAIAGVMAVFFAILAFRDKMHGSPSDWFPVLLFAGLGGLNYQFYKSQHMTDYGSGFTRSRNSWEKDPNWWKR